VIFDLDGVLVDSEPIANRVLVERLQRAGISLSESEVLRRFVGRTRDQCIALAAEMAGRPLPARFAEDWDAALFEALRKELKPVAGAADMLRRLQVPCCIASNGMLPRMRVALEAAGLLSFFEGRLFSATQVARPKPAPDLFLHAAGAMNVPPAASVVVEDTPIGVKAASAAGMRAFGFTGCSHSDPASLEREGAETFNDLRLLPGLLLAHDRRQPSAPDAK
jgi:HAD superfamily hydrolase (TIGR01509 family)